MKNSKLVFSNENNTGYNIPVVEILTGKYGRYAKLNGINTSEAKMKAEGFSVVTLSLTEIAEKKQLWNDKQSAMSREYEAQKISERKNQVDLCLTSAPIEITKKVGEICETADLKGTIMIDAYQGCGKGTAYVNDNNYVVAFHYGYQQPYTQHNILDKCKSFHVELSCTQICF